MLQLIALDVDGTLTNSRGEITAPVREAIHHLNMNEIRISIVSGRNTQGVESIMAQLGLNGWCISSGGALTINSLTGEVLERHLLDCSDAEVIIRTAREGHTGMLLEQALQLYWEGPRALIPDIIDLEKIQLHIVEDLLQVLQTDPLKLVLVKEHAAL
jgi:HAD superfamily hydrolase (TIGR01484 family)